ncbi:MAG: AMP-dependent synthetase/ligase [Bacteriovoracaceae bacterium]
MTKALTIGALFLERTKKSQGKDAVGWIQNHKLEFMNFEQYHNQVECLALGLKKHNIEPGAKIAILSNTCKEWNFMDLASLCTRAVVVPVYPTYSQSEIDYILKHSESSVLVIENDDQFKKIIPLITHLDRIKLLVAIEELSEEHQKLILNLIPYISYDRLMILGTEEKKQNPDLFEQMINATNPEDMASIVYTSGTTGEPKGAILSHGSFITMLSNVEKHVQGGFSEHDRTLTFLPLSHVFGRCDSLLILIFGWQMVFAEGIEKVVDNLALVRPTVMLAVPRIFEKIYSKVKSQIDSGPKFEKIAFAWAQDAAKKYFAKIDQDLSPSTNELIQYQIAYKLVFQKIYLKFGGKIRYFVSGGAPLSPTIAEFLRFCNLTILEGYGLTETVAPVFLNQLGRQILGTIGVPMGDVEVKFGPDEEILLKSGSLFKGYYNNPEATAEAFQDGWFHTGDIGSFNERGFLMITDRKKDIIVTSGGKKIAPQKVENIMKTKKHIVQFVTIGDKRNYLVALVGIEKGRFMDKLEEWGLSKDISLKELSGHPKVMEIIMKEVEEGNTELSKFETVKKIAIIPEEFTVESGLLTPSLKVKRKIVLARYQNEVNALYKGDTF